jgi:hypothetical protein
LEFDWSAEPGTLAHVTLGQGSTALLTLALEQDGVVARLRHASGYVEILDCGAATGEPKAPLVLEVSDQGRRVSLSGPDGVLATCTLEWPGNSGLAVGFGVSGEADRNAQFFGLRLARR